VNAFEAARAQGRADALRDELVALFEQQNQSRSGGRTVIAASYLRVTVTWPERASGALGGRPLCFS